jgi:hypothetical protein
LAGYDVLRFLAAPDHNMLFVESLFQRGKILSASGFMDQQSLGGVARGGVLVFACLR